MGTRILFATLALSVAILAWTPRSGRLSAADGPSPATNTPPAARAGEGDSQRPADGQVDESEASAHASAKLCAGIRSTSSARRDLQLFVPPDGNRTATTSSTEREGNGRTASMERIQGFIEQLLGYGNRSNRG